jgi:hypothetical protein
MGPPSPRRSPRTLCAAAPHLPQPSSEVTFVQHASKKPDRAAPDNQPTPCSPSLHPRPDAGTITILVSVDIYQDTCLVLRPGVMNQLRSVGNGSNAILRGLETVA